MRKRAFFSNSESRWWERCIKIRWMDSFLGRFLCGLLLPSTLLCINCRAENFQIGILVTNPLCAEIFFPSDTNIYFGVKACESLRQNAWITTGMVAGVAGAQKWSESWANEIPTTRYYRVFRRDIRQPSDEDRDGIDDAYELGRVFLNPLNPLDAGLDFDGDGVINLSEYQRGTDPTNSASRNVTLYTDSVIGDNRYDGLSSQAQSATRGPKRDIQAAIRAAVSEDAIQIAEGIYSESILDPETNSLELIPMTNVQIQ